MLGHATAAILLIPGVHPGAVPRGSFGVEYYTPDDIDHLLGGRDQGPLGQDDATPSVGHIELEGGNIKAFVTGPIPLADDQAVAVLDALAKRALPAWRWPARIEVAKRYEASRPTRVGYME